MELFHFSRDDKLNKTINDKLIANEIKYNYTYKLYKEEIIGKVITGLPDKYKIKLLNLEFNENFLKSFHLFNVETEIIETQKFINKFKIEVCLEFIRNKFYNHLPSRFKCIFLTENIDEWESEYKNNANIPFYKFEIIESISEFSCDSRWTEIYTSKMKFEDVIELCHNYWQGELTKNPRLEILFYGKLKVIKKSNFSHL